MTWKQFVDALRDVRDGRNPPGHLAEKLHEMGLITGSQSDAAGLLLTPRGRNWLNRIHEDTAALDVALVEQARCWDLYATPPKE